MDMHNLALYPHYETMTCTGIVNWTPDTDAAVKDAELLAGTNGQRMLSGGRVPGMGDKIFTVALAIALLGLGWNVFALVMNLLFGIHLPAIEAGVPD